MRSTAANIVYVVAGLGALSACGVLGAALLVPSSLRRIVRAMAYAA